jgi:hypothetical protein
MGKAQTVSEYEAVKEKWDKALAILNDIPSDVFISVTNLKNNYESKKKEVVAIIEDLKKPTPSPEPTPTSTPTVPVPSTPPSKRTSTCEPGPEPGSLICPVPRPIPIPSDSPCKEGPEPGSLICPVPRLIQ